jgi:hypothetical protein
VVWASAVVLAQTPPQGQSSTFSDFRPRREIPGEAFVGNEVCGGCHIERNRSQIHTAMASALKSAEASPVLTLHSQMNFRAGPYSYEITRDGKQSIYRVSDGNQTVSEPIAYVFGNAHVAETYVLRHDGKLYEGRVSYYRAIDGLDWTVGDVLNPPPSLEAAFGRDITSDEAKNCFSCHGTAAIVEGQLALDHLVPGVHCEACHGPGKSHTAAMISNIGEGRSIFNPGNLTPDTLSQEFCGACHRSANMVAMMPDLGGINNVRFQPYRLSGSRGHDPNDPHFACTACHDPHIDLPQQGASSDSKCTICHTPKAADAGLNSTKKSSPRAGPGTCPVANKDCDSCHMPKVEIPGSHFKFTDHRIRIVRPGEPYPI